MKFFLITLSLVVVCSGDTGAAPGMVVPMPPDLSRPAAAASRMVVPPPPPLPPQPVFTNQIVDSHALIRAAAIKHRVSAAFIKSIVAAESNFDCGAVSARGAIGLMQLMPATALEFGASDPRIPEQNVDAGTHYLRFLIDKYHQYGNWMKRVIAAYNAGPAAVDRFHGVPPYRETRVYVARVLSFLRQFSRERA